jgi:Asp-tRNA(Asn)/Glu-tRNA(Gln) amidotransferase A subunit family amidase
VVQPARNHQGDIGAAVCGSAAARAAPTNKSGTMPVGRDRAGMPVGLQLTAPACAEERLLAIARAAERLLGTAAVGIAS